MHRERRYIHAFCSYATGEEGPVEIESPAEWSETCHQNLGG
jgi:hypothetical protein